MEGEIKKKKPVSYVWKFITGFQLIASITLGVFVIAMLIYALKYFDVELYTAGQISEAKKIGNWEFPDEKYVLKNFGTLTLENKNIEMAEVKDKTSGNVFLVFEANFIQEEFAKTQLAVQNKLLEKYGLSNSYFEKSGKIERYGDSIQYSAVGWGKGDTARRGIIGSLDCLKKQKTGDSIFVFAVNSGVKYDESRALSFMDTLNCPASDAGGNGGDLDIDKVDTDNDGLTDTVETMLGANKYAVDTDGDTFSDFDELKTGHNPMVARPFGSERFDEYAPNELVKIKEDIKFASAEVYDKLFGGK